MGPGIRYITIGLSAAAIFSAAVAADCEIGFSRRVGVPLMQHYGTTFGDNAKARLTTWKGFIANVSTQRSRLAKDEAYALNRVNDYFNVQPYASDMLHWNTEDYWATPAEFLASNGGDCEDYAIAKYFALKELGVPIDRIRMVYVIATISGKSQPHMVLAYYSSPGADPLILDNNIRLRIAPATERPDLIPVYSFNDEDIASGVSDPRRTQITTAVRQWKDLIGKLERELRY